MGCRIGTLSCDVYLRTMQNLYLFTGLPDGLTNAESYSKTFV